MKWKIRTIFGLFPNYGQIRLEDGKNLCLEANINTDKIYLADCNQFNENQWFVAKNGNFNSRRFEMAPFFEPDDCLTQSHHPKANEDVEIRSCGGAREDNTSFWMKY